MRISMTAMAAVALALAGAAQASAANLLTNGSFETGDFSGWSQFGDTSYTGIASSLYQPSTDGAFQAAFGPIFGYGGISQAVGSAGHAYTVSFDLGNADGYGASVVFGGQTLLTDPPVEGFTHYSFTVTALDNSGLSFSFFNPPAWYTLDNVSVQAGAVPEPASWALMLGGFGAIGGALRSRRKAAVSFA